ncbi:SIR2-like protein [Nocardiopsis sp. Huas11]|uniref:SIR2 family protein n=1 Tax=Nocardiopsis sp. Huas11 TaxID=2183912 RepID=UPI000EB2AE53|nr:SIR2 family protein [Nocardiopsis sp. Huas11]RKS04952.1 SIR2-like protein [Nocardiopsis sp. Huas11]
MVKPISPMATLAMAMQAQPGVYAVLLGSGVSTGAGVPTGWGVVKELVRRLAAATDPSDSASAQTAAEDPERWWDEHGDGDLGYARLLEHLAPTAAARQGLLADFFEPSEEERADGLKTPSKAHQAVAELVKRGTVRVIVTTNFDRLMEQALDAVGVSSQVISRPEAVNGMMPLTHAQATVIKLHGDYKDLGSRNTPAELKTYPPEWTNLLLQVFDDYGLLVSGWSADWDTALVEALENTPSRRYPLWWDSRSSNGDTAQRLLHSRSGQVIPAAGADELFTELLSSVEALDRLAEPPLSTAMAVSRLKRYLPDPLRRIDLHDLVMDSVDTLTDAIADKPTSLPSVDATTIQRTYEDHLQATAPLLHLLIPGTWHDPDGIHDQLWIDAFQRLVDAGTRPLRQVDVFLDQARLYPAVLTFTTFGVVAAHRGRERLFLRLATEVEGRNRSGTGDPMPTAQLLHPNRVLEDEWINAMPRWNTKQWFYPASHLLKTDLRRFFDDYISLKSDFVEAFHGHEYRLGLIQEKQQDSSSAWRALSGEYVHRRNWSWNEPDMPLAEIVFRRQQTRRPDWPWTDFLGGAEQFNQTLEQHREILRGLRRLF